MGGSEALSKKGLFYVNHNLYKKMEKGCLKIVFVLSRQ